MKSHILIQDDLHENPYLRSFLDATICLRRDQLRVTLDNYRNGIGNAVSEYQYCCFAQELEPDDPDYFGCEGVGVYEFEAQTGLSYLTVMSESQFFSFVYASLDTHRNLFSDDEWRFLCKRLEQANLR